MLNSRFVRKEILWAEKKQKRIVPWVLDDVLDDYFPLVEYQGVTVFNAVYDSALSQLLIALPSPSSPMMMGSERRNAELAYLDRLRLEELLNFEFRRLGKMLLPSPVA